MGVFGQRGTYTGVIQDHLTASIKREHFGATSRTSWFVLAQRRKSWRKFVSMVKVKSKKGD